MDVADTFTSSIDGDVGANVGANVTLDHNYDGVHSAASRESRLCQKCISLTGPSSRSYKSLESEQCSRCSHQLSNQNRDRHNGSHSLNYCRNGMCIPKRESSSLPHEHERIHRQGHHLQCYRAVSPERSLTYPRCKAEQHTHLRSPNNALTPWPSADARMLTVPFHQGKCNDSKHSFNDMSHNFFPIDSHVHLHFISDFLKLFLRLSFSVITDSIIVPFLNVYVEFYVVYISTSTSVCIRFVVKKLANIH